MTDVAKQLFDIKEQQESIMEKVLGAMASADETTVETNKQLLLLHNRCFATNDIIRRRVISTTSIDKNIIEYYLQVISIYMIYNNIYIYICEER